MLSLFLLLNSGDATNGLPMATLRCGMLDIGQPSSTLLALPKPAFSYTFVCCVHNSQENCFLQL